MKTKSSSLIINVLTVAIFCLLAPAAFSFPFTDAFNYPVGNLGGNADTEGSIWAKCGPTNTTPDVQVTNIIMTYPGLSCPGTNSVSFFSGADGPTNGDGFSERIALAPLMETLTTNTNTMAVTTNYSVYVLTNGTMYYSF